MRLITLKTAECEGVEAEGGHFASVVAARVLSVDSMGDSQNRKAVIDAGPLGRRTVVCGAKNCRPGIVTAYVPSGTTLGGRLIEKRTIDGVESDGMLASAAELGVNKDHEGIVELNVTPGEPLPKLRPDHIIEVDNKSLTHRPDLWGHHGMAREVAAITGKQLLEPANTALVPSGDCPFQIAIADYGLCPRYSALVFDNVKVQPSPLWLQYRLTAIGLNPINNIVDVTNFIMSELAQPTHAFDADKLRGNTIFVRNAVQDEPLRALNGESYMLNTSDLVIADSGGAIALAGVIGGADSAISESTTRIVLESACFHPGSVRRTSARHKLRTDASMRFEKSQDPVNTVRGLARAVALLAEVCPGIRIVGGLGDACAPMKPAPVIEMSLEWLERKLGRSIDAVEVKTILERLMFGVTQPSDGTFSVTVPSWRATKDVSIKDDLVEEIGRMVGYATIPPVAPVVPTEPPPDHPRRRFHRVVRSAMAAQGFNEVYNYSFLSEEDVRRFGLDPAAHLRVENPISVEQALMRMSLAPGIWKNIEENKKHFENFRVFEIGNEIHKREGELPDEIPHLAAAIYQRTRETGPIYELKRVAECLLPGCELRPIAAVSYEHPMRAAEVLWRGTAVGRLFEFHPKYVEERAVVLDIDLAAMEKLAVDAKKYRPVRKYPESAFDLSVIATKRTLAGDLEKQIRSFAGTQLEALEFLRVYEGAPLPDGMKSVSFRLVVAAQDRTLSSEEVGAIRDGVIQGMRASGFEMRV